MKSLSPSHLTHHLTPVAVATLLALAATAGQAQTVSGSIVHDGSTIESETGTSIDASVDNAIYRAGYIADVSTGALNVFAGHSGTPGRVTSTVTFEQTLTNNTGVAQNVSFSFFVYSGEITARNGVDTSGAGFLANIDWGGTTAWRAGVDITNGRFFVPSDVPTSSVDVTANAADFGFAFSGSSTYTAAWDDYSNTLGLGLLNPGESRTLTYTMTAYSFSGPSSFAGYGGAFGFGGDPLKFETTPVPSGTPVGFAFSPAAPVPEPSTYLMFLASLGVVGAGARLRSRRRRSA